MEILVIGNLIFKLFLLRLFPCVIESVQDKKFIKISAGMDHSLALSNDNQLFAFGSNKFY